MPAGTKMGHVHLHVADVDDALRFYHELVGFDVMGHVPGVGFVSAGGYHHHLGFNVWNGRGAGPAPAHTVGLRHWTIELDTPEQVDEVRARFAAAGRETTDVDGGFQTTDPWEIGVRFVVG